MRIAAFAAARFSLIAVGLGVISLGIGGCAHSDPQLTLTSIDRHQTWRQDFSHAYCRRDAGGNLDIVLTDHAADQVLAGRKASAPVQQIMHIRVLWTPGRDTRAVASNAAIKWYVIGDPNAQDILEYNGTAFVSTSPTEQGGQLIQIQNAQLAPSPSHGALVDPLGNSRLQGSIVAENDANRVSEILGNVRMTLTAASSAQAAADESRQHATER